jgi:hypothetical protein
MGTETSVSPVPAQNQAKAGDARQPISAESRTRCRSAALPARRREMSQAALDASATARVTASKKSRLRSAG